MKIYASGHVSLSSSQDLEEMPAILFIQSALKPRLEIEGLIWRSGQNFHIKDLIESPDDLLRYISEIVGLPQKKRNLDQYYDELLDSSLLLENGMVFFFHEFKLQSMLSNCTNMLFNTLNIVQSLSSVHRIDSKIVFQIVLLI
jgi:hypothetical protein